MTDMLAFAYSRPPPPPKMPQGLRELMEELTREVLRHGPEDVHRFCANHMKKLLEIRDGPRKMRPLTLQEKQAKAQKILRYRTEVRLKKMDKLNDGEKCDTEEEIVKPPVYTEKYLKEGLELELFDEDNKIFEPPAFIKHVVALENVKKAEILNDQVTKEVNKNESEGIEPVADTNLSNKLESEQLVIETKVDTADVTNSQINNDSNKTEVLQNEELVQPTHNDDKNTLQDSELSKETKENAECEIKENKEEKHVVMPENIVNDELTEINKKPENDETLKSENNEKADLVPKTESNGTNEAVIQAIETVEVVNKLIENADTDVDKSNIDLRHNEEAETEANNRIEESNEAKEMEQLSAADIRELIKTDVVTDNVISKDSNEQTVAELDDKETDVKSNSENNNEMSTEEKADIEKLKIEEDTKSPEITEESLIVNRSDENDVTNSTTDNIKDSSQSNSNLLLPIAAAVDDIKTELKSNSSENIDNAPTLNTDNSDEQIIIVVEKKQTESEEVSFDSGSGAVDKLSEIHEVHSYDKQKEDQDHSSTVEESSVTDTHEEENLMKKQKISIENTPGNDDEKSVHTENLQGDVSSSNDDTVQESLSDDNSQNIGQTTMDLETAAITIQKVFRSFLFKSRNSTFDDGASDESTIDKDSIKEDEFLTHNEINKERRTLGLSRMDSVLQTVNEEKSLSLSTDDSSTLSSAATTIQAHVRGFLVRNKLSFEKTTSTNSLPNSNPSESTDIPEQGKSKTILNIHIVPESGHYVSRDDSLLVSMDLSMDGSPRTSSNLHPLGYDRSERRKQLKREDAIQSVSPPSNNSGKLSEDVDSVKEMPLTDVEAIRLISADTLENKKDPKQIDSRETTPTLSVTEDTVKTAIQIKKDQSISETKKVDLDEIDVVTPYQDDTSTSSGDSRLMHSGEFHDAVLPTKVSRNDSVIREFKNVLVYFLLWK